MRIAVLSNLFKEHNNKEVEEDLTDTGDSVAKALKAYGHDLEFFDVNEKTFEKLRKADIDFAFNVCERFNGNSVFEPHVAAMLELLNIPYTGSGPWALALCMNKVRVKEILMQNGIPTPKYQVFYSRNKKLDPNLKFPLIVKPAMMDNSIGITNDSIVNDEAELRSKIGFINRTYGQAALVEEYIEGRDIDAGVLGNGNDMIALPLAEISYDDFPSDKNKIFSYEAKWDKNSEMYKAKYVCPVENLSKAIDAKIKKIAMDVYRLLEIRDYGRVDIRLSDDGIPYVLEMNPNPGISAENSIPFVSKALGISYDAMIKKIFDCALARYNMLPRQQPVFEKSIVEKTKNGIVIS